MTWPLGFNPSMKRNLIRYSLLILCLALVLYFFLHGPVSVWMQETVNTDVLGFTPDGQCIWTYQRVGDKDPAVIIFQQRDIGSGKVRIEHRVALEISNLELDNTKWS